MVSSSERRSRRLGYRLSRRFVRVALPLLLAAGGSGIALDAAPAGAQSSETWSVVAMPNPSTAATPKAVSCPSIDFCASVGVYNNVFAGNPVGASQAVRDKWNGSSWSALRAPLLSGGHDLVDVSCASANFCVAVGSHNLQTLAEKWNGSSWSTMTTKNTVPAHAWPSYCHGAGGSCYQSDDALNDVSCLSATFCVAVGSAEGPTAPSPTLDEVWNGSTWSVMPSTNSNDTISAVSCLSTTFCMAVGPSTAAEWNGSAWSPLPMPNGWQNSDVLSDVSCSSPTFCVAVGSTNVQNVGAQTLAQEWNGSTWTTMTTTNPSNFSWFLGGEVSCPSPSFCVAVGQTGLPGELSQTLAEEWDGTSWSTMATINPVNGDVNVFTGVSCPAEGSCVAVGWSGLGSVSQMFSEILSSSS